MNAQPIMQPARSVTTWVMRLLVWVAAAFSLADFPLPAAQAARLEGTAFSARCSDATAAGVFSPVATADDDCALDFGLPNAEPALDGDGALAGSVLLPGGRRSDPAAAFASQCPDGQPCSAFHSRAPPPAG